MNSRYVIKYVSLQIARISLIDEKLDQQNNGGNIILFDVYFAKLFKYNILIMLIVIGFI